MEDENQTTEPSLTPGDAGAAGFDDAGLDDAVLAYAQAVTEQHDKR